MNLDELRADASADRTDTVLLALTDMQGRMQGKRMTARHFLDEVVQHAAEACNYLLAVDVDMNTVAGYAMSSWECGYGDFEMRPDLSTLRRVPWHEGTALCLADIAWADHAPVVASPRQILRRQVERLAERQWTAFAGTELEFIVFSDSYEQAWDSGYRNLTPANRYNVDYSMLGTARVEPLLRRIRNAMMDAGMVVENSKGECNYGQHEINFLFSDALRACDQHVIYKNAAKEMAAQEGMAITYMAKYDEREGNSCHLHLSLRGADGGLELEPALEGNAYEATDRPQVPSTLRDARDLFAQSAIARDAFGQEVVDHYLNNARGELEDRDERKLAELGYKQELARAWSGFSNFAISFTIISVLAGCFTTYGQAWNNGGPVAISWAWPIIGMIILVIAFCMSELVSAFPTAGGPYWWAAKLGGPAWSWFTGWVHIVGLLGLVASVGYRAAGFLFPLP